MVDIYSLVINGNHKIRSVIIKIKHIAAMIVVFTKSNILINSSNMFIIKKGEDGGPLSY